MVREEGERKKGQEVREVRTKKRLGERKAGKRSSLLTRKCEQSQGFSTQS